MYLALLDPAAPAPTSSARAENGGAPCSPSRRRPIGSSSRRSPPTRPSGEGDAHLPLDGEAGPHDVRRHRARRGGVRPCSARDVGYAGLKDKHATTRQWLSLPGASTPERAARVRDRRSCRVLAAARHPHKLRLGHLRGNRFEVGADRRREPTTRSRRCAPGSRTRGRDRRPQPLRRAALRRGRRDNAAAGWRCCAASATSATSGKRGLMLSALQSAVFNRALELRAARGPLDRRPARRRAAEDGDRRAVRRRPSPTVDQPRVGRGELMPHRAAARRPGDRAAARHARPRARGRGDRRRRRHARGLRARRPRAARGAPPGPAPASSDDRVCRGARPDARTRARCACASPCRRAATRRWWSPLAEPD